MLLSILNGSAENAPSLLGPAVHSGIWFYLLILLVIFIGAVFIITPVPENSVLLLAGALAAGGQVSLAGVLAASIAGAYAGYDLNYWTGRLLNLTVCRRFCPHVLRAENIGKARALMERYGPLSIVISRFIPAVNLPPFFAGLDSMDYGVYVVVNLTGAALWCGITVLFGYFLGSFDIIQDYANLLFDLAILVTIITIAWAVILLARARRDEEVHPV